MNRVEMLRPITLEARREPVVLEPGRGTITLWLGTALLVALGFLMVLNTSYFFAQERFGDPYLFTRKHIAAIFVGTVAMILAWRAPASRLRAFTYPLLLVSVALLAVVLVPQIGLMRGGARRWLQVGGLTFLPSEIAKLAVVFYLAHSIAKKGARVAVLSTGYLPHLVIVGLVAVLVVVEPDFGTAMITVALLFLMLVAGGARWKHLAATAALALPFIAYGAVTADYRWQRLTSFLNPWNDPQGSGFQLVQSLLAFGAGGVWGVGLGAGGQKMLYLPEAHTDFVFAVIGEELGLAGTLSVVATFALLAFGGYRLAWRAADPYLSNLALGLTSIIVLQAAVNMAVAVGLLPTKGLALPFVSYGGSALVASMTEVGLLLGVAREVR